MPSRGAKVAESHRMVYGMSQSSKPVWAWDEILRWSKWLSPLEP